MVLLVATQKLRYDGKELDVGNEFEASDQDAMILRAIDKAKDASQKVTEAARPALPKKVAVTPPPEPAVCETPLEVKSAEPVPEPPAPAAETPPSAPTEEAPPAPATSRYKRRDFQAAQE